MPREKRSYRSNPHRVPWAGRTALRVRMPKRVCETGKDCYETLAAARIKAEQMMESGFVDPGCHVFAFGCRVCNTFHVGNRLIIFPPEDE